jgi:uncharacterized protein
MPHAPRTPADLVIHPRNVSFAIGDQPRWWNGGDPVSTAFYNSLSATFPLGEAFFIKSVRHFRNAVPPALKSQIDDFTRQEAAHSREHESFNNLPKTSGYDTSEIESELREVLSKTKDNPPVVNLAMTVALEHFTAIMAHSSLKNDGHMRRMAPEIAALWKWHAIEEIEHKAVAYDVFLSVTAGMTDFRRWALRSIVMLRVAKNFVKSRLRNMGTFFKQDGLDKPATWWRVFYFLVVYPGTYRRIFLPWLAFFRPGFYPWNTDDRNLIEINEAKLRAVPSYNEGLTVTPAH